MIGSRREARGQAAVIRHITIHDVYFSFDVPDVCQVND